MEAVLRSIPPAEIDRLLADRDSIGRLGATAHAMLSKSAAFRASINDLTSRDVHGLQCNPNLVPALKEQARTLLLKGKTLEAIDKFNALLQTDALRQLAGAGPAHRQELSRTYSNRALCLLRLSDKAEEARSVLEASGPAARHVARALGPAAERVPSKHRAPASAAAPPLLLALAAESCSLAIAADPSNDKGQYRLSQALRGLGRDGAAVRAARASVAAAAAQGLPTAEAERLLSELQAAGDSDDETSSSDEEQEPFPWSRRRHQRGAPQGRSEPAARPSPVALSDTLQDTEALNARQRVATASTSGRLDVHVHPSRGRELLCAAGGSGTQPGQTLFSEKPYSFVVSKAHRSQRCDGCLAPLLSLALVPCPRCPVHVFCCRTCLEAHECSSSGQARAVECGAGAFPLVLPEWAVLAGRAAVQLEAEDTSDRAVIIQSLEASTAALSDHDLVRHCVLAETLSHCYGRTGALPRGGKDPETTALVLRSLLGVRSNGIAVVPPETASAADRVALALYPLASCLNHSCRPSVSMAFDGQTLTVRAVRPIKPGDAPLHAYGPEEGAMCGPLRRAVLREQYHFDCRCDACIDPSAALRDAKLCGFRCPDHPDTCSGPLTPDVDRWVASLPRPLNPGSAEAGASSLWGPDCLRPGPGSQGSRCLSCGAQPSQGFLAELRRGLGQAMEDMAEAESIRARVERETVAGRPLDQRGTRTAEQLYDRALGELEHYLYPGNQILGRVLNRLMEIRRLLGDFEGAVSAGMQSLRVLESAFDPAVSTQLAFQRIEVAEVLRSLVEGSKESKGTRASPAKGGLTEVSPGHLGSEGEAPAAGGASPEYFRLMLELQDAGLRVLELHYGEFNK